MLGFSSQSGTSSMATSGRFAAPLIRWIYSIFPGNQTTDVMQGITYAVQWFVRKSAHFAEYAFWGALIVLLLQSYHCRYIIGKVLLLVVCFSGFDECFQLLFGRTGMWQDALLDTCGAFFGALLTWLAVCTYRLFSLQKQQSEKAG